MLQVNAGKWADDKKSVIRFTTSNAHDAAGNLIKGERVEVEFADRHNPDILAKVPDYRLFEIDLDTKSHRDSLRALVKGFEKGTVTNEQLSQANISTAEEANAALATSEQARRRYLSEWDFIEDLNAIINSDTYKKTVFEVRGKITYSYNPKTDLFYETFEIDTVRMADPTATPKSDAYIDFYFTENAVEADANEAERYLVRGYTYDYVDTFKKKVGMPIQFRLDSAAVPGPAIYLKKLEKAKSDEFMLIRYVIEVVNGAQKKEITYDMLDDDYKESIDYGLCTLEDVVRALGGSVYGERERFKRIIGVTREYLGSAKETTYTAEFFALPELSASGANNDIDSLIDNMFNDDVII